MTFKSGIDRQEELLQRIVNAVEVFEKARRIDRSEDMCRKILRTLGKLAKLKYEGEPGSPGRDEILWGYLRNVLSENEFQC